MEIINLYNLLSILMFVYIIIIIIITINIIINVTKEAELESERRRRIILAHYNAHIQIYNNTTNHNYDYLTLLEMVEEVESIKDISNYLSKLSEEEVVKMTEYLSIPWIKGERKKHLYNNLVYDLYNSYGDDDTAYIKALENVRVDEL